AEDRAVRDDPSGDQQAVQPRDVPRDRAALSRGVGVLCPSRCGRGAAAFRSRPVTTSNLHQEIKELIVDALQLEDVEPSAISDTDPLFGAGLNLDSIDALELATAISRKYGIKVSEDQQ